MHMEHFNCALYNKRRSSVAIVVYHRRLSPYRRTESLNATKLIVRITLGPTMSGRKGVHTKLHFCSKVEFIHFDFGVKVTQYLLIFLHSLLIWSLFIAHQAFLSNT